MPEFDLPETFTLAEAKAVGLSATTLYRMRDQGLFEAVGRGLYRRAGQSWAADVDLVEIAARSDRATLCLTSALARHGLCDEIPAAIDVALPRGSWRPTVTVPVVWHMFAPATFDVGRELVDLEQGRRIGLYSAPRSIVDAFRIKHREGAELAIGALRRWLRRPGNHPAEILEMAGRFPAAVPAIRTTLEVLGA